MMPAPIYLDYNATTPVDPQVVEAMLPYFTHHYGNASSKAHRFGWDAEEAVEQARVQVANVVGAHSSDVIFTSGATESINMALTGYYEANKHQGQHLIVGATEHSATLEVCRALEQQGAQITYLGVDSLGQPDLNLIQQAIQKETILVCLMYGNNETGTLPDIYQIGQLTKRHQVPLMCDVTQSVAKVPVDLPALGVDIAVFSAHKIYGPKGIGALYAARNIVLKPQTFGGGQERGLRPGTLNVPGIVGFGKACELASAALEEEMARMIVLRDWLEQMLIAKVGASVNGDVNSRLPNVTNMSIRGVQADQLINRLSTVAISRGSACQSGVVRSSHVLSAMGLSKEDSLSAIRISLGKFTTREEVEMAVIRIHSAVEQLQTISTK